MILNEIVDKELLEQITKAIQDAGYNPKDQIRGYLLEHNNAYITRNGNARFLIKHVSDEILREYLNGYNKSKFVW